MNAADAAIEKRRHELSTALHARHLQRIPTPDPEMALPLRVLQACDAGMAKLNAPTADDLRRQFEVEASRYWSRAVPEIKIRRAYRVPANPELGSAAVQTILFAPAEARHGLVLFFHGGGWSFGSTIVYEHILRRLAVESGLPILSVDYRLAPETPFPGPLLDCVAAFRAVSANAGSFGLREGPIIVAGESAGANLALSLILHEMNDGRRLPDAGALVCGCYDDQVTRPSYVEHGDGFGLTKAMMEQFFENYGPSAAARNSDLFAPLRTADDKLLRLPPLYLVAAGADPLLSDTIELASRLQALGRADEFVVHRGFIHSFLYMAEFSATIDSAFIDLRRALVRLHIDASVRLP